MAHNFLQLNESKGELLLLGSPTRVARLPNTLGNLATLAKSQVRNLGVMFDSDLSFDNQVGAVVRACFFQLRLISRIKHFVSYHDLHKLILTLVFSKLDYCNALYEGITDKAISRLQLVQNAAARLLTGARRRESISPVLASLHWLPIKQRITFKTLMFVYKALNGLAPDYITELLQYTSPARELRSADQRRLNVPRTNLVTRGDRAFSVAGPTLWNKLPLTLRSAPDLPAFKRDLKTHLFQHPGL